MGESFVAISDDASAYIGILLVYPVQDNQVSFLIIFGWWILIMISCAVYHLDSDNTFGISLTSLSMDKCPLQRNSLLWKWRYFGFSDVALSVFLCTKMTEQFSFGGTVNILKKRLIN